METLNPDTLLAVPSDIALCPYCQGQLYVGVEGWEQDGDGTWLADCIVLECETEPELPRKGEDDIAYIYDAWYSTHSESPYVYWLPVENKVKNWLNENYRWELD